MSRNRTNTELPRVELPQSPGTNWFSKYHLLGYGFLVLTFLLAVALIYQLEYKHKPNEARICIQVITTARSPYSGETKEFPTPCDVPVGWEVVPGVYNAIPGIEIEKPVTPELCEPETTYIISTKGGIKEFPSDYECEALNAEEGWAKGTLDQVFDKAIKYENFTYGYELLYVSQLMTKKGSNDDNVRFHNKNLCECHDVVIEVSDKSLVDLENEINTEAHINETYVEYSRSNVSFAGESAVKIIYSLEIGGNINSYIFKHNEKTYLVSALEDDLFNKVLSSFKFTR